ncbi:MAG: HAD family phosphatase [Mogibacterium sp.]|nr:HAD family phosphatase [Mogibacterium sp.]
MKMIKNESELLKKNIKMVALDLDGTTFNSAGDISERNVAAIEEAAAKGVHVVVSTGRPYTSLPDHIKEVKGIEYAITSNGAHVNILESGESIYNDYLAKSAIKEVAKLKVETGADIEVFIKGQAYVDQSYYDDVRDNGCDYRRAEYVLWSRKPVPDVTGLMLEHDEEIENINFVYKTLDMLEAARPKVNAIENATITSSFKNNLEVGGPNTSKKAALLWLMKELGISSDELMCCGDAPNDIQMAELAGIGVAVANAWGGLKDHADYITESNDDDGVGIAIEKFVLKK